MVEESIIDPRVDQEMGDPKNSDAAPDFAGRVDFHSESVRKSGVFLTVVSLFSSAFAWLISDNPISRGAVLLVACFLLYLGLRMILARKLFRTWFDKGRVYWEFPSRIQGNDDSCAIADIAGLNCTMIGGATSPTRSLHYDLILKDGSKKAIGARCMGDVGKFLSRIREENPRIEYTEADG